MPSTILEKKYKDLKEAFPDEFIFFFDREERLNFLGKIAQELLECRKANAK